MNICLIHIPFSAYANCNISHSSCIHICIAALSLFRRPSSSIQRSRSSKYLIPARTSSLPSQGGTAPSSLSSSPASSQTLSSTSRANRFSVSIGQGKKAVCGTCRCLARLCICLQRSLYILASHNIPGSRRLTDDSA
jgi:hypothetical protein